MKIALFVLIPLIIFTIVTYVYLRLEQVKFVPKDKYDEAWNKVYRKKKVWDISFNTYSGKSNSSEISMGLGLLSCITLVFQLTTDFSIYSESANFAMIIISGLISCIGLFASIAGFFIGASGAFQTKNESPAIMKYGGILFSTIGIFNISFVFIFFSPIALLLLMMGAD